MRTMAIENDNLRAARIAAGFESAADAARALGVNLPTYYAHENGNAGLPVKAARRYAQFFGVDLNQIYGVRNEPAPPAVSQPVRFLPVCGIVQAGIWRETDDLAQVEDFGHIPVVADPAYAQVRQYAVRVEGNSMDKVFEPGSYAAVADWASLGRELKAGDIVVLERRRAGLYETTLKRVRFVDKSRIEFVGESSELKWCQPINVRVGDGDEIIIRGLVIGKYQRL